MKLGALEAGGTKMVCAIGDETGKIYDQVSIPTETPDVTIPKLIEYFEKNTVDALGIASFGPVELDPKAPNYGYITTTTKVAWRNFDMAGSFARALKCPIGFDTDVNGSVLGEVTFGQARGKSCVIYLTIGTGVGAGIYIEDKLLHGMLHPEAGHVLIEKRNGDAYAGKCPYHRNCLEGLAAGPAIEERWGKKAVDLADKTEVWQLEADYIAQALTGYVLTLSPEMIILGGGVMHQKQLFPLIRAKVTEFLGGYIQAEELRDMDHYIVPASLHDDQGIMGCLELARRALQKRQ
ncbi:MAG: ROK family protein [Suilimivivens sp.]|nr:ROK family protein [Lachnospiraceae bacterium]